MPVKYIGRTTDFSGKTLWEIVGNLKNFGVGRLVKRNMFERYPEPSFLRVLKVEAAPNEECRKVRIWAEKVFRGQKYPKVVEVFGVSYKPDYRLVPKSEERILWDRVAATPSKHKILPDTIPFPPLLKYMLVEEMSSRGETLVEPKLKLKYQKGRDNFYKRAEQDGKSPLNFPLQTTQPQLYQIKQPS